MGLCENCNFWAVDYYGICDFASMSYDKDDPKYFDISADASDDTGLVGLVAAGPDLGCVHFQSKKDAE